MSAKPKPVNRDHQLYGGRINMPGYMMTKAGKRAQMQKDNNRPSPRKGKRGS
jgi:hypothetical protein